MRRGGTKRIKRKNTRSKGPYLTALLLLLTALLTAYAGASIWQGAQEKDSPPPPVQSGPESEAAPLQSEDAALDASSQSEDTAPEPMRAVFGEPVPESERVHSRYFDDAVFVGDSITEGIKLYSLMENATVIASKSVNLSTIYTAKVIKAEGGNITIMEALEKASPAKIYILIGANSLAADIDSFIGGYGDIIDDIKAMHPQSLLYVQSILPITKALSQQRPEIANSKIDECNARLRTLAGEKKVYYVDVAESFKGEDGYLPNEASPKDGMHFGTTYYKKWFEYLKTHTVN